MEKKVLIVDHSSNLVFSLEFIATRAGFSVKTAIDGELALKEAINWLPNLILLDINIPKLDGFEVCQRLRERHAFDQTKIIFLSAKGYQVEIDKGIALGADDYITKPFSSNDIITSIKKLLCVSA